MENNLKKKKNIKEHILSLYQRHKKKFYTSVIILIFFSIILIYLNENKKKQNILLSEKYIKAQFFLNNGKNEKAKQFFEDLILSESNFYSILALNTVLEKKIINDQEKILKFFEKIEKKNFDEEIKDLIIFKKGLFLLKIKENEAGEKILNNLINKNSNLKALAEDIVK